MSQRPRPPLPPQLGPFVVGAKIGGGGMASVYLGRRANGTAPGHNLVALKVIKDELAGERQYADMFGDEARILSRLDHPGIIRHVEYGQTSGYGYIAMELVLGRSLMDVWEACNKAGTYMPIDLGAHVGLCVAEALEYAHKLTDDSGKSLEVIHRDVNPTNVFLTYDGKVKLIDFGLAKSVGRMHKSVEGIVKGKVPYLAPEQILEEKIDHRTDVYALGATLWEMTTGRRLFKRETDGETIRAIRAHVIADPRTIVDGWYPEGLWKIVERALAKNRDDRQATAGDLANELREILAKYGRKIPLQEALAEWLEELFPGEHKRQSAWLIEAAERALPRLTMHPPAPIAEIPEVASSAAPNESIAEVAEVADVPSSDAPSEPEVFALPPPARLPDFSRAPVVEKPKAPPPKSTARFVAVGVVVFVMAAAAWVAMR